MKNRVRLTEADLTRLVKRVIQEQAPALLRGLSGNNTAGTGGKPSPTPSVPRNISLSLDCGKKTLGKLPMTTQQIGTWCKVGISPTTQPSSSNRPNDGSTM